MTPRTTAGRALLAEYDDPEAPIYPPRESDIDAIEREAAQQERERIRKWMVDEGIHHPDSWVIAILADNSPSASAEPDGEPSDD